MSKTNEEIDRDLEDYSETEALFLKLKIWFDSRIDALHQVSEIPQNKGLVIQDGNQDQIELTGDSRSGFLAGVAWAIEVIGEFPIEIES